MPRVRVTHCRHGMGGEKAPVDGLFDGRIKLLHLDQAQGQLTCCCGVAAVTRPLDGDLAKAHGHLGRARRTARLRPNLQLEAMLDRPDLGNVKQSTAPHQGAIATGARQQMGALVRNPVKLFVDVAFAVADHGDHCRQSKGTLGARRPLDPTMGFLLFDGLPAIVGRRRSLPRPNLHSGQPSRAPLSAPTASTGCTNKPGSRPLPDGPSPRTRPACLA